MAISDRIAYDGNVTRVESDGRNARVVVGQLGLLGNRPGPPPISTYAAVYVVCASGAHEGDDHAVIHLDEIRMHLPS